MSVVIRSLLLKTRAQCRCDSSGRSANNLCMCAGTVLPERQAGTIHTLRNDSSSTILPLCSQCLQTWDAIVHRTARPQRHHWPALPFGLAESPRRVLAAHKTLPSQGETPEASQTLRETTSDFMLQGLDSLTHLLTQRRPLATLHSGSGAPRTGTLNSLCLGLLVVLDSDDLAQLLDAVGWPRLREQISRITLCRNLHHI